MKIIVIGMDNTGKTTLVNELSNKLNIKSVRSSGPNRTKEEMMNEINNNLNYENDLILERFPIVEELIYGNTLRNNSKFTIIDLIEEVLKKYKVLFIYCRPSNNTIFNFGDREQMEGVIEKSEKLLFNFDSLYGFMKSFGFNIIKYNYEKNTIDELLGVINNEYNTCKKGKY